MCGCVPLTGWFTAHTDYLRFAPFYHCYHLPTPPHTLPLPHCHYYPPPRLHFGCCPLLVYHAHATGFTHTVLDSVPTFAFPLHFACRCHAVLWITCYLDLWIAVAGFCRVGYTAVGYGCGSGFAALRVGCADCAVASLIWLPLRGCLPLRFGYTVVAFHAFTRLLVAHYILPGYAAAVTHYTTWIYILRTVTGCRVGSAVTLQFSSGSRTRALRLRLLHFAAHAHTHGYCTFAARLRCGCLLPPFAFVHFTAYPRTVRTIRFHYTTTFYARVRTFTVLCRHLPATHTHTRRLRFTFTAFTLWFACAGYLTYAAHIALPYALVLPRTRTRYHTVTSAAGYPARLHTRAYGLPLPVCSLDCGCGSHPTVGLRTPLPYYAAVLRIFTHCPYGYPHRAYGSHLPRTHTTLCRAHTHTYARLHVRCHTGSLPRLRVCFIYTLQLRGCVGWVLSAFTFLRRTFLRVCHCLRLHSPHTPHIVLDCYGYVVDLWIYVLCYALTFAHCTHVAHVTRSIVVAVTLRWFCCTRSLHFGYARFTLPWILSFYLVLFSLVCCVWIAFVGLPRLRCGFRAVAVCCYTRAHTAHTAHAHRALCTPRTRPTTHTTRLPHAVAHYIAGLDCGLPFSMVLVAGFIGYICAVAVGCLHGWLVGCALRTLVVRSSLLYLVYAHHVFCTYVYVLHCACVATRITRILFTTHGCTRIATHYGPHPTLHCCHYITCPALRLPDLRLPRCGYLCCRFSTVCWLFPVGRYAFVRVLVTRILPRLVAVARLSGSLSGYYTHILRIAFTILCTRSLTHIVRTPLRTHMRVRAHAIARFCAHLLTHRAVTYRTTLRLVATRGSSTRTRYLVRCTCVYICRRVDGCAFAARSLVARIVYTIFIAPSTVYCLVTVARCYAGSLGLRCAYLYLSFTRGFWVLLGYVYCSRLRLRALHRTRALRATYGFSLL